MLAVLCAAPRPPLGVAILGLIIVTFSWMLYMLPYIMFCGMIALSIWPPSHPLSPDVTYYPVYGRPNQVHVVYTRVGSQPSKEARSFELNAELRILVFLLAIPVTSVVENAFFRPARSIFLRTIECWFDMRYVHPAQMTGSWPNTWTPIFNALRSCEFVADFIDGATGRSSGPSLAHMAEAHISGPFVGTESFGGFHSMAQPAEQTEPSSYQCKGASTPDSIVPSILECSPNAPRPRKTFVSPPHVSPQSPWKANDLGGFSPVSKNLSRIVGVLFHHPPPRKPVIRPRINLMDKVPSTHVPSHVLERLWSRNGDTGMPAWASMSSLGTAIYNSLIPWHYGPRMPCSAWDHVSNGLVPAAPDLGEPMVGGLLPLSMGSRFLPGTCAAIAIEQTQPEQQQFWEHACPPLTSPPFPEPPVQTLPQNFVSGRQEEQSFQPWSMQTPVYHGFPCQNQHVITPSVYKQQELDHQQSHGFPSGLDSMDIVPHELHVYSGVPEQPMADHEARALPTYGQCTSLAPVLDSPLPPFSLPPVTSQEQFTFQLLNHVPPFQFSEDAPHLDHSPLSASPARREAPEMAPTSGGCATTAVFVPCTASDTRDGSSHSSPRPVPFHQPPKTVWSDYHHQSPTLTSPVLLPRQPFWDLGVTRTFTFDISRVAPHFDFSHHAPPPRPHPEGVELDVIPQASIGVSGALPPISASHEYPLRQVSFDQGVQSQQEQALRDPGSQPQEVVFDPLPRQPCVPAEQAGSATDGIVTPNAGPSPTGANMAVDNDDGDDSGSDSDSSYSSDSDTDSDADMESDSDSSSSDDDSDSDSDSDSSEDESDTVATEAVCKTASRAPDASSKAQDDVQGFPTNKDTSAPAATKEHKTDSDSDSGSEGYCEHMSTSTPPGAPDNDDSSPSDEDMSDHEEEYRLYWEKFYTPRHRRQPVSSGSV